MFFTTLGMGTVAGRRVVALAAGGLAAFAVCTSGAAEVGIRATQVSAPASSFTLDFGAFGETSAFITSTQFDIVVDPVGETAVFENYQQAVDPLTLPGGVSTGAITVQIVPGSSSGAFTRAAAAGEFVTSDVYRIYFEGDLSLYGLTSPVDLPGASVGVMRFATSTTGRSDLRWDGTTELSSPFGPLTLSYSCSVSAEFVAESPVLPHDGDMNCDGSLDFFDIDPFVTAVFDAGAYGQAFPQCSIDKADVNDDASVDFFDVDPFVELLFF